MPNHGFVKILRSHVNTLCNQETSVNMLLPHAPFSFLDPGDPFPFQTASFTLLSGFAPVL